MPAEVHDTNNEDVIIANLIYDAIGESMRDTAPGVR